MITRGVLPLNGHFSLKKGLRKTEKKKDRGLSPKDGSRKMEKKRKRTEKYSTDMDLGALGKAERGSRVTQRNRRLRSRLHTESRNRGAKGSDEVCVSQHLLQVLTEQGVEKLWLSRSHP